MAIFCQLYLATLSSLFVYIKVLKKVFDCELANAVQGITILACWPFAYNKPFTQFEAYYVKLCNTSFVWHELTRLFKTSLDLSNLVDANWQDCSKQVMTSLKLVKTCLKDFTNRYVVFSNWQDCLWQVLYDDCIVHIYNFFKWDRH